MIEIPVDADSLHMTTYRIEALSSLGENWNGYSVAAPRPESIKYAIDWMRAFYDVVASSGARWVAPLFVSPDESGDVVLEWHNAKEDHLSLFLSPEEQWFLESSEGDTIDDMIDGNIRDHARAASLLAWVYGDGEKERQAEPEYGPPEIEQCLPELVQMEPILKIARYGEERGITIRLKKDDRDDHEDARLLAEHAREIK